MLVHQAFRYELAPTAAQRASLTNHAGAARWAWNWGLSVRRKAFTRRRQTMNAMDLHRLLNRLKRTPRYGWLYEVSKCAPRKRCVTWIGPTPTPGVAASPAGGSVCPGGRNAAAARSGSA